MIERYKITPASYLILKKDNKILLGRRFNAEFENGNYMLVSGHVEIGETFTEGLIREVKEEVGVDVKGEDLKVVHTMNRKSSLNGEGRIDIFFMTEKYSGEPKNMEPNKCDDLDWFDIDNLPKNTVEYIKFVIDKIKNNIIYSEYGW